MGDIIQPGMVIDNRYELISHLGSGGFGVVYKAKQLTTGQLVAVKIARVVDEKQSSGVAARFKREMDVVADLSHPNIVRLIDAGQLPDKRLFAVLELIRGVTLSELLQQEGPMDPGESKHLMMQVLDALCSAHDLGVIHRDLKPANIMVTNVGARRNALVVDFGIATFTQGMRDESYQSLTPVGAVGGTPSYMAPEQLHGKQPNPQTDIYAWGLVFLESLTGRRVVRGNSIAETMFNHLRPDPHPLPPSVAMHPISRVLRGSLSKDAVSRYPNARVALQQLTPCDVSALRRMRRQDTGVGLDSDTAVLDTEEPIFTSASRENLERASTSPDATQITRTTNRASSRANTHSSQRRAPTNSGLGSTSKTQTVVAERRQLTAMVAELGPMDELSELLDPGELYSLITSFRKQANSIVRQLDGIAERWEGARLVSYFGYPLAHEDDACRAVQAALEIAQNLSVLDDELPAEIFAGKSGNGSVRRSPVLKVQVGIHTGLVVTSNLHLSNSGEISIVGDVARIAVRLQEHSAPGTVLMSQSVERLVRERFVCVPDGVRNLGVQGELNVYRVRESIGTASTIPVHTSMAAIGREQELTAMLDRWEETLEERGQVVLVSGEAGIGKSHLVTAFRRRIRESDALWIDAPSSPYLRGSAFHPLLHGLSTLFGFQREDDRRTKRDKMRSFLDIKKLSRKRFEEFLIVLLELSDPPESGGGGPPSPVFKQPVEEQLLDLLFGMSEDRPLVIHLEDLHWADPSTLEFMHLLVDQAPLGAIYVLAATRPSYLPDWRSRSHVARLPLARLPRKRVEAMIRAVTGEKRLPDELVAYLADKTDGVPLFVEELTRTVLESDALTEDDKGWHLTRDLSSLSIPVTLRGSLMARLDRLGEIKEVVQIASIVGRDFTFAMLEQICEIPAAELSASLQQLVQAELVIQRGRPPRARYVFKHALVQDTAYESLLDKTRRHYHERIGDACEQHFPEIVMSKPELVAHHYSEARQMAKAVPLWLRAGTRAFERSALAESIQHLSKGLELLRTLPESHERDKQELTMVMSLGLPYMATRGYASREVAECFSRAFNLCRKLGEEHVPTLWGLWIFYHVRGEYGNALELGEQLYVLAERSGDPQLSLAAHQAFGSSLLLTGDITEGRRHFERGLEIYDARTHGHLAFIYGHDPAMYCNVHLSMALFAHGEIDRALAVADESIAVARAVEHPNSMAFALCLSLPVFVQRGDMDRVAEQSKEAMALCSEYNLVHWLAFARFMNGLVLAEREDLDEGVSEMQAALGDTKATGARIISPFYHAVLANKLATEGRLENAFEALWQVQATNYDGLETFYEATWKQVAANLLRQRGDSGDQAQAESLLREAIAGAADRGDRTAECAALGELIDARRAAEQPYEDELARMRALRGHIRGAGRIAVLARVDELLAQLT